MTPNPNIVRHTPDEENWSDEAERDAELGLLNAHEARMRSGLPVESHAPITVSSLGAPAVTRASHLEEVTDDHEPASGTRREASLRKPRRARTWREKMAADQPPEHQRVTPLGQDYPMTGHRGGRA